MSKLTPAEQAARRRTFAIISHPDAGKTTLTENLLLSGGAIRAAGAVRARGQARRTQSDWMKIERERGISVSASVMTFDHAGLMFNLCLDDPVCRGIYRRSVAAVHAGFAGMGLDPLARRTAAMLAPWQQLEDEESEREEWSLEEIDAGVDPRDFTIRTLPERIAQDGDLWAPLLESRGVDLRNILK